MAKSKCSATEEHQAHMAANGECPWCGDVDTDEISDDNLLALIGEKEFEEIRRCRG